VLAAHRLPPNLPGGRIEFRPAVSRERPAVSVFLQRQFGLPADAPLVGDRHMTWKYWRERSDWTGPRSLTARSAGCIVAHAGVWPLRIRVGGEIVSAAHVIDWAASPEYFGAGIWLMRQVQSTVPLLVATGGSDVTKRILPVIGFRPHSELSIFARPVRPLGQAVTAAERNWKFPGRVARNAMWRLWTPAACPRGWSATRMMPEALPDYLWPRSTRATAVIARDAEMLRYFVDCPTTRHVLFGLARGGELVGYCCVAFTGHVARIADLWLWSTRLDDWTDACRAAASAAAADRSVYEVSAWASTRLGREAWMRAGFRERDRLPLTLSGDAGPLQDCELHMQMIDCDASFLADDGASYLT